VELHKASLKMPPRHSLQQHQKIIYQYIETDDLSATCDNAGKFAPLPSDEQMDEVKSPSVMINELIIDLILRFIKRLGFDVQPCARDMGTFRPASDDAIQILLLNMGSQYHWVCSALINGKVYVADSANVRDNNNNVVDQLKRQLWILYADVAVNGVLTVMRLNCDQQAIDSVDCGVFAIAFAILFAQRIVNLSSQHFDRALMRKHLHKCLTQKMIASFPTKPCVHQEQSHIHDVFTISSNDPVLTTNISVSSDIGHTFYFPCNV
jgi:hypothetical protein